MRKRITRMFLHRMRMGMTQAELAARIGVTQPRVSAWENRVMDIPRRRALQIGEVLGLDPEKLTDDA